MSTYNEKGYSDYSYLLTGYDDAYDIANKKAGEILTKNLQDQTAQSGLALAGWKPGKHDMEAQAVDWWKWGEFSLFNLRILLFFPLFSFFCCIGLVPRS